MRNHRSLNCSDIQPFLVEQLSNETGWMRESIDRHVTDCEKCQEWVLFLKMCEMELDGESHNVRHEFRLQLEEIACTAERCVMPGHFARRLIALSGAVAASVALLFGRVLPPVGDLVDWIFSIGFEGLVGLTAGSGIILLFATPLLLYRPRRTMEGS